MTGLRADPSATDTTPGFGEDEVLIAQAGTSKPGQVRHERDLPSAAKGTSPGRALQGIALQLLSPPRH